MRYPRSPYDQEGDLVFFPRMLDKIRLQMSDELPLEYHSRLGEGLDGRCCKFLKVSYKDVIEKVKQGLMDHEVLAWCFNYGKHPDEDDVLIWNKFMLKTGWRDEDEGATQRLQEYKKMAGLENREDIITVFDFFEVDENRKK